MKMKTALCLSGHMRTYKYTSDSLIKNIIEPLNCDVYIHTWDIRDHTPHGYYEDKKDDDFCQVDDILKPKEFVVDDQNRFIREIAAPIIKKHSLRGVYNNKADGVMSMYYKRKKVFELVEQSKIEYDMIISTRPDILCSKEDLSEYGMLCYDDFDLDYINLPPSDGMKLNCTEHKPSGKLIGGYGSFGGCTDIFAAGNMKNMATYSSMYDKIIPYVTAGCPMQAERLLLANIVANNLRLREIDGCFGILRDKRYEDR